MNPRDHVSSLARGLEVLRAFNRTRRKMTLSEVAAETGNTRAGARRILLTLVHEGYAVADGKLFDLTPQVLELGYSVLSSKGAWDIARPFIDHLSEEIREILSRPPCWTSSMWSMSAARNTTACISVGITVGARFPAHCTATGRVLLAAQPHEAWPGMLKNIPLTRMTDRTVTDRAEFRKILEDVREKGWSLVDQELEIGPHVHRRAPAQFGGRSGRRDQRGRADGADVRRPRWEAASCPGCWIRPSSISQALKR